ncbi:glycosyltransferase [Spirosoma utsteinense]|uniref:Cellulose synthase/poly-beta-1,6-N-acetylglucosamine synthase-like glycosyltransferase n=1 Tax=Spirosoma utsteinense TaxID=2585773 RepID=A0ABR6W1L4_9BACT|nr:glycosyltransferase [Spirosoma utsteinense]MBC3786896.1 cellulose synthase/poly-beta-1,6-N-acetylglucosamine synthase-like glycosyltransferase [Spirosoma utsteinense]MBC3789807.1 cellulose synthase/poly-beta-1,6-N-acetylglucosamine synthase-like glycosyltransferase [Spirosoma utsteinense]
MNLFSNPEWIEPYAYSFGTVEEVPQSVFDEINARLDQKRSANPLVSILVAAYNEEINILRCISTLSALETEVPFEIIAINNNSQDRTQVTMDKLHINCLYQPIQGCGPARQLGQEQARGTYILLADADCLYPTNWLNKMLATLQQPGVVCVYGRYSFISTPTIPRWHLFIHETLKDAIAVVRHFKRPYLNAYGISMGYVKEAGMAAGYIMHNTWGDDGRLCFDMMKYGKVRTMTARSARVWTAPRSLLRDGTAGQALRKRITGEVKSMFSYLSEHPAHDTKTSKN